MFDFSSKKVLITGASRGIGRAIALAFADSGARVAINYCSNDDAAGETLQALNGHGHLTVKADLSLPEGASRAVEGAVTGLGRLDIVVKNAGIFVPHPVATTGYLENVRQDSVGMRRLANAPPYRMFRGVARRLLG